MPLDIETTPEVTAAKVRRVALKEVAICDEMQPRLRISEDAVRRYKDRLRLTPDSLPAVLLAVLEGSAEPVVVDGWHRFQAHRELGCKTIMAKVIRCSLERAKWLAALANMNHGLPLERGDQRRVFRRYVAAGENKNPNGSLKSYREIEADLGGIRSKSTLNGWMHKDFPTLAAEMAGREEIEAREPKEATTSWAQRVMQDYATGLVRVARTALKEDKEDIRSDILGHAWFVVAGLGAILDLDAWSVLEAARKAEEDMMSL